MKSIPFLSFLLFTLLACSISDKKLQKGFVIDGSLTNLKSDSVFLENTNTGKLTATKVENGKFRFEGKLEFPSH